VRSAWTDSYITDELNLKISELSGIADRLCYLVDLSDLNCIHPELIDQKVLHCQIAQAILSFCINAQGVYIVHKIRPDLSSPYVIQYDNLIDRAISCLVMALFEDTSHPMYTALSHKQ